MRRQNLQIDFKHISESVIKSKKDEDDTKSGYFSAFCDQNGHFCFALVKTVEFVDTGAGGKYIVRD